MILPGLNRLFGSKLCLICRMSEYISSPTCRLRYSVRAMPTPCSPDERPLELLHQRGHFVGDLPVFLQILRAMQIQHRAHVQQSRRRVPVIRRLQSQPAHQLLQLADVGRQILGPHRRVLDEADRLGVALAARSAATGRPCATPTRGRPRPAVCKMRWRKPSLRFLSSASRSRTSSKNSTIKIASHGLASSSSKSRAA